MGNDHTAWMPVYWRDVLAETTHLSPAQFGAYCLLIASHWNSRGPLPADPGKLRRIARMDAAEWAEAETALASFFVVADGLWRHGSVSAELLKAEARYRARSEAGRLGGQAKGKPRSSLASPPLNQPQAQAHESPRGDSESPAQAPTAANEPDDLELPDFLDRRSNRHASRLAPDWDPSAEGYAFASSLGLDRTSAENILAQFRDHWLAKPGPDALKRDWDATWRNWLRKHVGFHGTGAWPADGGRRPGGDRQGGGGVVAAVRALLPTA